MAKPVRSPLLGYNHNVKYKGRIYHVQTEDSGPANPRLFTHLYFEGTILASKKHEYDALSAEDVVRGLMQGQHKAILKDLKQSVLDDKLTSFFARRSEPFEITDGITQQEAVPIAVADPLSAPLDLDSLPVAIVETPPPVVPQAPLPTGGVGVYVMKKSGDGLVPEGPRSPSQIIPPSSSDPLLPVVVFDPAPAAATPPPVPRPAAPAPSPPRFPASAHTPRPQVGTGVVVQRQVVVGAGAPTPPPTVAPGRTPPPRTRRPAPAIPYVVKEGSHTQTRPTGPPARPMVPPPAAAPRSATSPYTQSGQPAPQADVISDKSLDEVILAYLSQGDVKE